MNNSVRILVVDDDPDILNGTAHLLEKAGYTVDRASSGEESLQAVQKHRPDLLLLDHDMPGINGIEVCRRIKRDPAMADSLVVIVSGSYTESDEQAEGLESGADGYIVRPIANRELLARVRSFVRIIRLTSSLRLNAEELKKSNEAVRQAHLASLNLMEDAVVARDRAEQASQALKESEEKHRLLVENSHDILYTLTAGGVFTFVSPAWTVLLGHPVTQVTGQSFQQFVHPDDIPGCMVWLQKVIETEQRQEGVEYRVRHTDGSWYWHTSSAVPLRDKAGTVVGFEGTARDITERKKAEEALKKSETLLFEMTTQVPGLVYQFYARSNGQMGFYYISDRSEQVVGLKADLEGYLERFIALVLPEYRDGFVKSIEKSVKELSEWKYEGILQKPSGEKIYFFGNSTPSQRKNEIVFNGIVQDITARKKVEVALHESERSLAITFNSIGDAVMATDAQSRIVRMNRVAEQLTGWPLKEALGRPLDEVFHIINQHTRLPLANPVSKVLETGKTQGLANDTVLVLSLIHI